MNDKVTEIAQNIFDKKYSDADCMFLAGSVVRDEVTSYSDLDLVVLYKNLKYAYRDSFTENDWPIEVFVHDFSTLKYFCIKMDAEEGTPALPQMIDEGIVIPQRP